MTVAEILADESSATGAHPRIVAALIARTGDWSLAEDCTQEAIARALDRWPVTGVPDNPGAWLMTVARNLAIDVLRRRGTTRALIGELAAVTSLVTTGPSVDDLTIDGEIPDDRLRLLFTCCHPALSLDDRVALTLRTVCGVPTGDIARALVVSESTMTRRITRAKTKIAEAEIPYVVPSGPELAPRRSGVLSVVYLLFTGGHDPAGDPPFAWEALRLARLLADLQPDEEANALLALILLTQARHATRRDAEDIPVGLEDQDRSLWDRSMIAEGLDLVGGIGTTGPFAIQARLAAEHARADRWESTDWPAIVALYDVLYELRPDPVVALNRAIATGHGVSPDVGLALLAEVCADGQLTGHHSLVAAEAHLAALRGDLRRAELQFRHAMTLTDDQPTRTALHRRAERLVELIADGGRHV